MKFVLFSTRFSLEPRTNTTAARTHAIASGVSVNDKKGGERSHIVSANGMKRRTRRQETKEAKKSTAK
jgi:hypothetical protein